MAKVKEDISRVRLQVDGKQGINELGKLEMEAKELSIDMKNAKKGTDEYVAANKKLKQVKSQIKGVRKELGVTGMTMTQLSRYQRELRKEISNTTTKGTAEYKKLKTELNQVNKALRSQRAELNGTKGFFSDIKKELKAFGVMALSALGASALFSQIQSMIDGSAKLSDSLADVQKTTNLTDQELAQLNKRLKAFNTRTPRSELRGLAEIAGRLGIKGVKDIEGFVRAADKINVALGDVLGDPEKVMRELGKLTETFNVKEAYGIEDSLIRVGSAINELGMASTANEGYMVEFSKRLGGVAPLAGITIQNVLGLGATLDSLGQTSEVSTTALSKLFLSMAKNADQYAKYAKLEVAEFVELLNTDANEAFLRVLEGVKDNSAGITQLAGTLGDLGQDGGRVIGVLGTLANNVGKVREQQEIANRAFKEGTSVVDEYNIKNENFAANLAKVQKWLAGMFVNSSIMNGLNSFVAKWADWIKIPVSETIEAERIELLKLHAQILTTNEDTGERVRLINEMKKAYPDHLGNLDAEKVSNEELSRAVKSVNDQLINKIILQEEDEKISKQNQLVAENRMRVFEQEDKVREQMIGLAEKYNLTIKEGGTLMEQAADIHRRAEEQQKGPRGRLFNSVAEFSQQLVQLEQRYESLNTAEGKNNALMKAKKELMDRLGIDMDSQTPPESTPPEPTPPADPDPTPPNPTPPVDPDADKKKLEKMENQWKSYQERIRQLTREYELLGMEDQQREVAQVQDKYEKLNQELVTFLNTGKITEEQYKQEAVTLENLKQQELDDIRQKYREKEKTEQEAAKQEILEATSSEKELAIIKTNEHYDELLAMARKFGFDTKAIEDARRRDLLNIQQKFDKEEVNQAAKIAEAKTAIAQGLSQAIGGAIDFIGNQSGELTTFQKILTGAQIAIDLASGLGKIVPLALEAASGTGPAAPFVFAGHLATMGGLVFTAIAKAKNALSSSDVPTWEGNSSGEDGGSAPRSTRNRSSTTSKPVQSYFTGGDTGNSGLGFGDRYGEFAGYVHKDEYVVPSFIRSHPYVADVLPAIESIRQENTRGYYKGGSTTPESSPSPSTGPKSDPEMLKLLRSIDAKLDAMPTSLKAYLVDSELEEFQEKRKKLKDKYTQ